MQTGELALEVGSAKNWMGSGSVSGHLVTTTFFSQGSPLSFNHSQVGIKLLSSLAIVLCFFGGRDFI